MECRRDTANLKLARVCIDDTLKTTVDIAGRDRGREHLLSLVMPLIHLALSQTNTNQRACKTLPAGDHRLAHPDELCAWAYADLCGHEGETFTGSISGPTHGIGSH